MFLSFLICSILSVFQSNNDFDYKICINNNAKLVDTTRIFLDSVEISFKESTLKVVSTYINDSVSYEESNMFNPICIKQILIFYSKGIKVSSQKYPVRMIYQENYLKEKILMQENVISEIGVVDNGSSFLFTLSGYGGCNSCPMYDALYSPNGNILWNFYGNEERNGYVIFKKGNLFKILKNKKIDKEKYLKGDYKKVSTYPVSRRLP